MTNAYQRYKKAQSLADDLEKEALKEYSWQEFLAMSEKVLACKAYRLEHNVSLRDAYEAVNLKCRELM